MSESAVPDAHSVRYIEVSCSDGPPTRRRFPPCCCAHGSQYPRKLRQLPCAHGPDSPVQFGSVLLRARVAVTQGISTESTALYRVAHCLHYSGRADTVRGRALRTVRATCPTRRLRYEASANRLRQHGHSPSHPLMSAANADGCGMVVIALNANGARCA